jgi:hypothetical protein
MISWQQHIVRFRLAMAEVLRYRSIEPVEGRVWTRLAVNPPILWETVYDCLHRQRIGSSETAPPRSVFMASATLLNLNGKMACHSFGLPAGPMRGGGACPAAAIAISPSHMGVADGEGWTSLRLRTLADSTLPLAAPEEFVCNRCYGLKGQYGSLNLIGRSAVVMAWVVRAVRVGTFVPVMSRAIDRANERAMDGRSADGAAAEPGYFRLHDTGDFFSPEYFDGWVKVARTLPAIKFWSLTKAHLLPELIYDRRLPRNLIIRPSSPFLGVLEPDIGRPFAAPTVVGPKHLRVPRAYACPATHTVEKSCISHSRRCRMCWERPDVPIKYAEH